MIDFLPRKNPYLCPHEEETLSIQSRKRYGIGFGQSLLYGACQCQEDGGRLVHASCLVCRRGKLCAPGGGTAGGMVGGGMSFLLIYKGTDGDAGRRGGGNALGMERSLAASAGGYSCPGGCRGGASAFVPEDRGGLAPPASDGCGHRGRILLADVRRGGVLVCIEA